MKIFECKQNSPEWWELHRGRATASSFHKILTAKTQKLSSQCNELICELIAQEATLGPIQGPEVMTRPMERGIDIEPEARRWYEMERGLDVREVGFCLTDDGRFGCSPDGLVGEEGGLELKCPLLKTHVGYLTGPKEIPGEYKAQVHGCLIVTEREWWDFLSYAPGLPPFMLRVVPDSFTHELRVALEIFWSNYQEARKAVLQ